MKKTVKLLVAVGMGLGFMLPSGVNAYQVEQDPINFGGYFPGCTSQEMGTTLGQTV